MGLFSSLFGSKAKTTSTSSEQSKNWRTPYDQGLLDTIQGNLTDLAGRPGEYYPGQTYANLDPLQEAALKMREGYATNELPGMIDPAMSAWRSTLDAPDVANNPYVQNMLGSIKDLANRNFQENMLPAIQMGGIGAGQLGSSRQGVAEGIAGRGTQEAIISGANNMMLDAYGKGLAQQQYGIGATPMMAGLGGMPADVLYGVGDVRRGMNELAIGENMSRHAYAQEEPWQRLERTGANYGSLIAPYDTNQSTSSGQSETTTRNTPSLMSAIGQVAGLGMGLGGFFGGAGGAGAAGAAGATTLPMGSMGFSSMPYAPMQPMTLGLGGAGTSGQPSFYNTRW